MKQSIPVVNLRLFQDGSDQEQATFIETLGKSIEEYGFVAIENHGVPQKVLINSYQQVKELFDLTTSQKMRYEQPQGGRQRGYTSPGLEKAKGQTRPDLKEFWHVGPELSLDHPRYEEVLRNVWPDELALFKDEMLDLWRSLNECGHSIMTALARYLGGDETKFSRMIDGGDTILRCIKYPSSKEGTYEPGRMWAAAHEDINLLTLLPSSIEPGLELQRRDGTWMAIEPVEGQLIVDTGDMFERLTNGRFPAMTHRVVAPQNEHNARYSMPFFIHPHPQHVLTPLHSCVSEEFPRKWEDVTAQDFLRERLIENGVWED